MDGFQRRKEQKKENIRRAAIELYKMYGFGKVNIGDIARKANVSHVTIYNHFGSKEGIVRDVMKTVISDLVTNSREIIEGEKSFLEKLELIILNKAEMAGQYQGELMKMVVRDYPEMQQFVESLWRQEIDSIINILIEEGKKLGYIRSELSSQAIRYYFEIIRTGAFSNTKMLDEIKVDAKLARDLNYLFLFGLVEKQG
jgi:AcrR family transcriptional regulator